MERESKVLETLIGEVRDDLGRMQITPTANWGKGETVADDVLACVQNSITDLLVITSVLDIINKPNYIGPHTQKIINCAGVPVLSIKKVPAVITV